MQRRIDNGIRWRILAFTPMVVCRNTLESEMHPVIAAQLAIIAHYKNEPQYYSMLYYSWKQELCRLVGVREEMAGNWSRYAEMV